MFVFRSIATVALAAMLLLSACSESPATFTVSADKYPPNTVIQIKNLQTGAVLKTVNLTPELKEIVIKYPERGYGRISVEGPGIEMDQPVYIEGANYQVKISLATPAPLIAASSSKGQQELMDYFNIRYADAKKLEDSLDKYNAKLGKEYPENYIANRDKIALFTDQLDALDINTLYALVKKHPASNAIPLVIYEKGNFENLGKHYQKIMTMVTDDVRESYYGKKATREMVGVLGTVVGATIPDIAGKDLNGASFKSEKVLKKVNVVICWLAYNNIVRRKHADMIKLYNQYKTQGVEFIGVSYDKNIEPLKGVVKVDKLPWPQFTDLKGAKSPNIKLNNAEVPYLFIIDENKKIISANINLMKLEAEIARALSLVKK